LVSPTSQYELDGNVTLAPAGSIVPSVAVGVPVAGGVCTAGMNSSTIMMVTTSVCDPLIVGPSSDPVVMSGRFNVVSASTTRSKVRPVPGPGRLKANTPVPVGTLIPSGPMIRPAIIRSRTS
jgi:hypothetical protein